MQTHIKTGETSQGKMLSGFVNKYLNERGTFSTKVCQYTFGLTKDSEPAIVSDADYYPGTEPESAGLKIKFPQRKGR